MNKRAAVRAVWLWLVVEKTSKHFWELLVEESLLMCYQAPFFSIMPDECTDVTTVEEFSFFCRGIEKGELTEQFMDLLP